jgi:hypothetical protein
MLSVPSAANTVAPNERAPNGGPQPPRKGARRKLWFFVAVSAVAGAASTTALRQSTTLSPNVRSGSPGFRKSSTGIDQHWAKKSVTVYLDASLKKLGPEAPEAVMQAFGQWAASDRRLPDLAFDSGSETSAQPKQDGKSTISFDVIKTPGHERDVAITITYSNDKTGEILEADTILNARYAMGVLKARPKSQNQLEGTDDGNKGVLGKAEAEDCQNRYDTQNVATHEAGHFFGLGEDMVERGATMFLSIDQCETHKRALSLTDVGAVATLYAQSEDAEEAKAGPRACSFGAAPASSGAWAIPGLILGLTLLRRRQAR